MIKETLVIIPDYLAVWCINCRTVNNSPGERCASCDSVGGLLNIAKALSGEKDVTDLETVGSGSQPCALDN